MNFIKTNLTYIWLVLLTIALGGVFLALHTQPSQKFGQSELQTNQGGTATTSEYAGGVMIGGTNQYTQAANSGNSVLFWDSTNSRLGIGSSTPWAVLSIGGSNVAGPLFAVGTSSAQVAIQVTSGRFTATCEDRPATTTTIVIDWANSCPMVTLRIGPSATTITFINATSANMTGSRKIVNIDNPSTGTAGAVTFVGCEWYAATQPAQTTAAGQTDTWSFLVKTSTTTVVSPFSYKCFGAQTPGGQ